MNSSFYNTPTENEMDNPPTENEIDHMDNFELTKAYIKYILPNQTLHTEVVVKALVDKNVDMVKSVLKQQTAVRPNPQAQSFSFEK